MSQGNRDIEFTPLETRRYTGRDVLILAALGGLVALAFWEVVAQGRVFFFRDFALFFYPKRFFAAEAIRNWSIPFWNSYSGCGEPVLGTYQPAVFYPPALIYYILPMPQSFMWFVVLHFFISGAGAYYMMRAWGVRRVAAAFTAFAWAFSPAFAGTLDYVSFQTSLAWMPWCLAFARNITSGARYKGFLLLTVALTMAILAAAPEPVIFTAILLTAYALWSAVATARRRGWAFAWKPAGLVLLAIPAAIVLSGVEVAPFLHTLRYSARQQRIIKQDAGLWSAHPTDALLLLLPRFYLFADRGGIYWRSQHWLKSVYIGVMIPFLAGWTLLAVRRHTSSLVRIVAVVLGAAAAVWLAYASAPDTRTYQAASAAVSWWYYPAAGLAGALAGFAMAVTNRRNLFFFAAAIPFVLMAAGPNTAVWSYCYDHIPGIGLIRFPVKFYLPAVLSLAALAGFAVDDVLVLARRRNMLRPMTLIAVILGAALLFAVAWAMMKYKPAEVYPRITPRQLLELGETGNDQAAECYESTQWSFGRSSAYLALGAGALLVAVFLTRMRIPRPYGGLALALTLFLDMGLFGAHLNPVAGKETYTDKPSHLVIVPHDTSDTRLFMTSTLRDSLRKERLARIHDLYGLENYIALVKGIRFQSDNELLRWLDRTSAPPFENLRDLDEWLKTTNSPQFVTDIEYEVLKETFYPNTNILYHAATVDSFEPMTVKWQHDVVLRFLGRELSASRDKFLTRMLAAGVAVEASNEPPGFVYLPLQNPGTRGVLAGHVIAVDSEEEAEATLLDTPIDVMERVILFRKDAETAAAWLGPLAMETPVEGSAPVGSSKVLSDEGNRVTFEVTSDRRALLFVADTYFPNFAAVVDGNPAPLWRANYAYRAVPVDAGTHVVEFVWRPYDFYAGLAMTLAGIAALTLTGLRIRNRNKAASSATRKTA